MGTRIITFGGGFCYYPLMNYDLTYVDKTYTECAEKVPKNKAKYVETKETDRRRRIAKMLLYILEDANDDITIIDSDVYIPSLINSKIPLTYCIPARAKPYDYIIVFCQSTNIHVPYNYIDQVKNVIKNYLDGKYWTELVDINIHLQVPFMKVGIPGTRHFVNGVCYELTSPITFKKCDKA
jgi:hypothetical protein